MPAGNSMPDTDIRLTDADAITTLRCQQTSLSGAEIPIHHAATS
jgi:hypothetical protein